MSPFESQPDVHSAESDYRADPVHSADPDHQDNPVDEPAPSPERRAAALAGVNGGAISGSQLVELGLTRRVIRARVARGSVHDLGGDVYAWGHALLPPHGWDHAALLSVGSAGALSHQTAAALHGLIDWTPTLVDVVVGRDNNPTPCRNVRLHRARALEPSDITSHDGRRLTTPARTVLDLAPSAGEIELRRIVEVAIARHGLSASYLLERCRERGRAPGTAKLRRVLLSMVNPTELRSKLERRFRSHWERAGHPPYEANAMVEGLEVDGVWWDRRLVLEIDVYESHGAQSRYRNDRRRGRILAVAGFETVRLAGEDYDEDPDGVVADLAQIVAARPSVD